MAVVYSIFYLANLEGDCEWDVGSIIKEYLWYHSYQRWYTLGV